MNRWPWHPSSEKAWPASGTTLKTGLAQLLSRLEASGVEVEWNDSPGMRVSSSAFTSRSHVEQLTADLTGAEVSIDGSRLANDDGAWIPDPSRDEVVSRTPGSIGELRLRADPVTVEGVELRADVAVTHAPLEWILVRRNGGLLGTFGEGRDDEKRARGAFRFSMAQEDIAALALSLARSRMRDATRWTASAKALKLAVKPQGENRFVVTIGGAAKVFFVPMSARVGFDVSVSEAGEVTVHRATAASKSFLTKLLLLPLRPQLRAMAGTAFQFGSSSLEVSGLKIDADGGRLSVRGDLRARGNSDDATFGTRAR